MNTLAALRISPTKRLRGSLTRHALPLNGVPCRFFTVKSSRKVRGVVFDSPWSSTPCRLRMFASDPFDDVPQHCRPPMFPATRPHYPWEETPGGDISPDQHPPATDARANPLAKTAPSAWCFGPATPPNAAAPTTPAVLPAPRAAVATTPLVQAAQADSPPQPATASSPGPQQPTGASRRRKMLRPRSCTSGPAPLAAPAALVWAVDTELADDSFLLALQAAEQKAEQQARDRGGAEGGGDGGGSLHREARPRSAAAAESGSGGGGWGADRGGGGIDAPSSLPDHPRRRRKFSEIHAIDETHGASPVGLPVDMRRCTSARSNRPFASASPLPPCAAVPPCLPPDTSCVHVEPPAYLLLR